MKFTLYGDSGAELIPLPVRTTLSDGALVNAKSRSLCDWHTQPESTSSKYNYTLQRVGVNTPSEHTLPSLSSAQILADTVMCSQVPNSAWPRLSLRNFSRIKFIANHLNGLGALEGIQKELEDIERHCGMAFFGSAFKDERESLSKRAPERLAL